MKFKIINYNILNGFHSVSINENGKYNYTFHPERLEKAKLAIKEEDPDILILTEACFSKDNFYSGKIFDYNKEFNFPYSFTANYSYDRGISILSKFEIKSAKNYCAGYCPFVGTKISIGKKVINLDAVHPHPDLAEEDKSNFIASILRDIKKPYILAGDFNSLSFEDKYDEEKLINGFFKFDKNAKGTIKKFMQKLTISKVKEFGLKDTFIEINKNFDYTIPTDLLSKDKDSAMRVDYIFCSKDIKVKNSGIIKNDLTNYASDHYPTFAVLELK